MWSDQPEIRVFSGICPDEDCRTKLFFPSYAASSIECTGCGKHFDKESLNCVQIIQDSEEALRSLLRSVILSRTALKKGTDLVKVRGYSNYHCRILSPIFTWYGVDKTSKQVKLLREMGQGEVFDCSHLGDKGFSIEPEYLETPGYGRDKSGSASYLQGLLDIIQQVNNKGERIVPLHVDGDGHCLVHAISRALTGREIFWHALMINLQKHLKDNLTKYTNLFSDFISSDEWDLIISEADPNFEPQDDQPLGLRNIHIFGLANVLRRPIMLLDSISGIQSSGDYTGTFLPALVQEELCKGKDGKPIPPLAIAWSSSGRNHYIPLVNLRNKPATKVPRWVVPKAWGIPNELVKDYIDFGSDDTCVIGGTKVMHDAYIQLLMKCMDEKFLEIYKVSASLVTEVHQFVFKPSGLVGVKPKTVIERTRQTVQKQLLLRCLSCNSVCEYQCPVNQEWLLPGGHMYNLASSKQGRLSVGELYSFPESNVVCEYNAEKDVLEVVKYKDADISQCVLCNGSMRTVKADGLPIYRNGDRTNTPVTGNARCPCGFKHFWDGREYENQPEILPVLLEWGGKTIKDNVYWFQYETDETLNSNVYSVAEKMVQKHFPGEFGSERLVQKVVDTILRQTAKKEGNNKGARPDIPNLGTSSSKSDNPEGSLFTPSKMILTGQKKKTFHKEELNKSDAERKVKIKTEHHAAVSQNKQSRLQKTPEKSPGKSQVSKPEQSPSSPRPTSASTPRTNKRIRLSSSTGGQQDLTLPLEVTYSQLQEAIERELGVPPKYQKIRYGFPPRLLQPPEQGKEQEPIPVQHNERVTVEVLPPPDPTPEEVQDVPEEQKMDVAGAGGEEIKTDPTETKTVESSMEDTAALASALVSALSGAMPDDMWDVACRNPHMFEKDGYYYNLAFNSLGPLQNDQHCTIPYLPKKVFAYNKEKDRLDLCLGNIHVHVQPINQETLSLANAPRTSHQASSVMNTEASFSGAITSRHLSRAPLAFMGEGRSLLDSTPVTTPSQPEKQQESSHQPSTLVTRPSTIAPPTSQAAGEEDQVSENPLHPPLELAVDQTLEETPNTTPDAEMGRKDVSEPNPMLLVAMETTPGNNESEELPVTPGADDVVMDESASLHTHEGPGSCEESQRAAGLELIEVDQEDDTTEDNQNTTGSPMSESSHEVVGLPRDVTKSTDIAMEGDESYENATGSPDSKSPATGNPSLYCSPKDNGLEEKGGTEQLDKMHGDSFTSKETDPIVAVATDDKLE